MPLHQIFNHDELTTPQHQLTLLDEDGIAIADGVLDTLTLTFYNRADQAIINSRDGQNVLDLNQVSVVNGVVTWLMLTADTPIIDDTLTHEYHIALWEWTYSPAAVTLSGKHETRLRTRNLVRVP